MIMERASRIKRLFSLGDYKNITYEDEITGIPAELAVRQDVMDGIVLLQTATIESNYRRYLLLNKQLNSLNNIEKQIEYLTEQQELILQNLIKLIKNGHIEEKIGE